MFFFSGYVVGVDEPITNGSIDQLQLNFLGIHHYVCVTMETLKLMFLCSFIIIIFVLKPFYLYFFITWTSKNMFFFSAGEPITNGSIDQLQLNFLGIHHYVCVTLILMFLCSFIIIIFVLKPFYLYFFIG
jgi:hypothetical protein